MIKQRTTVFFIKTKSLHETVGDVLSSAEFVINILGNGQTI